MPADTATRNMMLVLCISGFTTSFSFRTTDPMIGLLARDLGGEPTTMALLTAAFALPYALIQPIVGPIGDAAGKERVMQVCVMLLTLTLALGAAMTSIEGLFLARMLSGAAAGGVVPLGLAMIGDRVSIAQRQVALSRYVAAMILGGLLGSPAAGIVSELFGWRAVFIGCAIMVALGVVVTTLGFREIPPGRRFDLKAALRRYREIIGNPRARALFALVFIEGGCFFGMFPYIATFVEKGGAGPAQAGLALAGFAIGGLVYSGVVPLLVARLSVPRMFLLGGIIGSIPFIVIGATTQWALIMMVMILMGIGYNMMHNSFQAQVTELSQTARASAIALHAFSFFMGQAIGVPLVGLAISTFGQFGGLALVGSVAVGVGLVAAFVMRGQSRTA